MTRPAEAADTCCQGTGSSSPRRIGIALLQMELFQLPIGNTYAPRQCPVSVRAGRSVRIQETRGRTRARPAPPAALCSTWPSGWPSPRQAGPRGSVSVIRITNDAF
jgi:hypothetical protein